MTATHRSGRRGLRQTLRDWLRGRQPGRHRTGGRHRATGLTDTTAVLDLGEVSSR